jgi:hypothetical protein
LYAYDGTKPIHEYGDAHRTFERKS